MAKLRSDELDRELEPILRSMETLGVKLDVGYLEKLAVDLEDQLKVLEEEIFDQVGHPFSLGSPKQLSQVLFEELALVPSEGDHLRKKATGFSTAAAELEKMVDRHPVIPLILRWREVGKILSTYVLPLPQLVDSDHRLHTHYAPDAASGRLSSRKPNLQNIPNRTELGRNIRAAFIAEPGWQLLAADYSQIQLRIIAHLAQDQVMLEVFRRGDDIHQKTSEALQVDRRTAKAVNFGIIYGLTAYGLAESLHVSREEAQAFISGFLATYPGVATYMTELIERARTVGYTETLYGKRRPLPDLTAPNELRRKAAERIALNHPIQGTEAEIMKLAMIQLAKTFAEQPKVRMILQVHDELVFELPDDLVLQVGSQIQAIMESALTLEVPLSVDLKLGRNWAAMDALLIK